jgi:hypothetical protein
VQVEARLRQLEGRSLASDAGKARGKAQPAPYEAAKQAAGGSGLAPGAAKAYNADADVIEPVKKEKKEKKEKKKDKEAAETNGAAADGEEKKKKKKRKADAEEEPAAAADGEKVRVRALVLAV